MKNIDDLLNYYAEHMPETVYLMKNKDRYPAIEKAAKEIAEMAQACDEDADIKIYPDELTGTTLCLDITSTLFTIDCLDKFCKALKMATTFEACPLTNGKLSVGITFQNAWVPAPPRK